MASSHGAVSLGTAGEFVLLDIESSTDNEGKYSGTAKGKGGWKTTSNDYINSGTWIGEFIVTSTSNYQGDDPSEPDPGSRPTEDPSALVQARIDALNAASDIAALPSSGASYQYSSVIFDLGLNQLVWRDSATQLVPNPTNTVVTSGNLTVVDFGKIDLSSEDIVIEGSPGDIVIARVGGSDDMKMSSSTFTFTGGITAESFFVYYEGDLVDFSSSDFAGTLLAPEAFVKMSSGSAKGVVISGNGFDLSNVILDFAEPIPEPSTLMSAFLGLGVLMIRRRTR